MQLIIDTTLPEIAAHLHTLRTRLGGDLTEPMSAVAALLENNQTADGIRMPAALAAYTGFDFIR